jgi:hypothetical protein
MNNIAPETLDALERFGEDPARHYDVELDQYARLLAVDRRRCR